MKPRKGITGCREKHGKTKERRRDCYGGVVLRENMEASHDVDTDTIIPRGYGVL